MIKNVKRILCACTLAALTFATSASAQGYQRDNGWLFWDYRVVITQTCVRTPNQAPPANGFDPVTKALRAPGESLSITGSGLLRFAPGGILTLEEGVQTEASLLQLAEGQTPITPPASYRCTGSYTLAGRKLSLTLSCEVQTGNPSIKVTVGPQNFQGYIGLDGQSINLTNIAGEIQTITVTSNNVPVQERQRICTQSALAIK